VLSPREPEPTVASLPSAEVCPTASDPVEIQATPPTTPAAPLAPPAAVLSSVVCHSSRVTTVPSRLGYDRNQGHGYLAFDPHAIMIYLANNIPAPSAFKVNADPDTLTYNEAMADLDRDCWLELMLVEITSLESMEAWDEAFTDEARTRILPGTWVFRRKRNFDGMVTKFKARYCVRGDLQEDDSPTYAPVVAWSSVRIFLVLTMTMGWYTCSIDFLNAFVQAVLKEPIWIHLPRGFLSGLSRLSGGARTCLRLKKSLYGTKFTPRLWYHHLFRTLVDDLGFCQSDHDACLLTKKHMILVVFVDDAGIGSKRKEDADNLVQQLVDRGFELTREGTFSELLGIKFDNRLAQSLSRSKV